MERGSRVLPLRVTSLVEAVRANNATKFRGDVKWALLWARCESLKANHFTELPLWLPIMEELGSFREYLNAPYIEVFDEISAELNAEFLHVR